MDSTQLRVYGGVTGDDRKAERRAQLIEAGLELLGAPDGKPSLTVRGVCGQAGLTARYFYESFADRDALAVAVFDHVTTEIATTTLHAVQQARHDTVAKVRAGLSTIVRSIAADPRRGRVLFSPALSNTVLAHRRVAASRMFAGLLSGQVREFYGDSAGTAGGELELITEFLVGGLAQTLASWLDGSLARPAEAVIDQCVDLFVKIGELTAG